MRTIQASDCGLINQKLISEYFRNQIDLNRPKRIFLFQIDIKINYKNIALFSEVTVKALKINTNFTVHTIYKVIHRLFLAFRRLFMHTY